MTHINGTVLASMESFNAAVANGRLPGDHSFSNGPEKIKQLSASKNSLQSNTSAVSNGRIVNGFSSLQSLADYEERLITISMDSSERRFGFSVIGGADEGFPPRIDEISDDSPAARTDLCLDDEIVEVNDVNVEKAHHVDVIMKIHKCIQQKSITLKVRRLKDIKLVPNGDVPDRGRVVVEQNGVNSQENMSKLRLDDSKDMVRTRGETSPAMPQTDTDGRNLSRRNRLHQQAGFNRISNVPSKYVNPGFESDDHDVLNVEESSIIADAKSLGFSQFVAVLDLMKLKLRADKQQDGTDALRNVLNSKEFQSAVRIHNKMTKIYASRKGLDSSKPVATNSQFLVAEVRHLLMGLDRNAYASDLLDVIGKPHFKELLNAHDRIAMRESLETFPESETEEANSSDEDELGTGVKRVKIVQIDKTDDPLGATVRNEGDAVIIGRIMKGGAAEKSGLLHEGDEILEINDNPVRGKDVNEVVELLSELEGTLTFVLVPGDGPRKETLRPIDVVVMKALFDYEPGDDELLPCEELGLSFRKGDLLEILNQDDPDWWQARHVDDLDQRGIAGLIPSKPFQLQRELAKITLPNEDKEPIIQEKKRCFCGRQRRKGKKVPVKVKHPPIAESEVLTYEDMVMVQPDPARKRPVVLVGPPHIGRKELKDRLIEAYPNRFAAPIPHTTRSPGATEVAGRDFIFVSKGVFEKSIGAAEFVEHGVHEGHFYGTTFESIRAVISSGKVCILNLHVAALPVLRSANFRPYVVFITLPRKGDLQRLREFDESAEPFNPKIRVKPAELDDMLEKARDMNRKYGHLFDKTIVNSDFDNTYSELRELCNYLEAQPQWIPSSWVR